MRWLVHDFGPNFGDNFRGFLFLKALKEKFPAVRMTCWITPDLDRGLGGLRKYLGFLDHFLVRERSPRETYLFNFGVLKGLTQDRKDFVLEHFPGGLGPDGKYYEKIIPNSEPWMTAKWIHRETLHAPDSINQGEFLRRMLNLSMEELEQACPLFGQRQKGEGGVGVGLCRPREKDRKQPSRTKIDRIWDSLKRWDGNIFALDYQSGYPIPQTPNVKDRRLRGFAEKVSILNRASLFIGIDGGLNHFAAACGCPTLSFYGEKHGADWGERVGPYPRKTPFGEHMTFGNFEEFLSAIDRNLAQMGKEFPPPIKPNVGRTSFPLDPSISGPSTPRPHEFGPLDPSTPRTLDPSFSGPSTPRPHEFGPLEPLNPRPLEPSISGPSTPGPFELGPLDPSAPGPLEPSISGPSTPRPLEPSIFGPLPPRPHEFGTLEPLNPRTLEPFSNLVGVKP